MKKIFTTLFLISVVNVFGQHVITVDGDPSDWLGTASSTAHDEQISNGEYIYTGESADRRTDAGMTDDADITEVRFATDGTSLFGLVRLNNYSTASNLHISLAVGTNPTGDNYAWIGSVSNTILGSGSTNQQSERQVDIHWTGSAVVIEMWSGFAWYAPPGAGAASAIAVSTTNNVVEFSISLTDLGITGSTIYISLASFMNQQGNTASWWNNDGDGNTTANFTTTDAVDCMTPGYSGTASSWIRDLSDGDLDYYATIDLTLIPLPVELTSFTTTSTSSETVTLNWTTATEVNNYGFDIQSRLSGAEWTTIGFVEGHGNSNSPKDYSFVTTNNAKYYRLKQIDTDGGFEYSDVVEVESSLNYKLSQNHPNPFNPTTTINFTIPKAAKVNITVYNALGQKVAELANGEFGAGNHSVKFNAASANGGLNSGIYFYRLVADGESASFSQTMKMLLLK